MGPNSEQQMIEEQAIQEPDIDLFKAVGKLADADYQAFIPQLESLINEYGKISLLLELEDFHGWQPTAAWDDFKIGLTHADDFERIAIVGDRDWARWIARLASPFTHAEVRCFDHEDRDAAWDWLKQNALSAALGRPISTTRYHHVLIAIDFSTRSAQVLERGLVVASQTAPRSPCSMWWTNPTSSTHSKMRFCRRFRSTPCTGSSWHVPGYCIWQKRWEPMTWRELRPKVEIPRDAERHGIDLIVTGSHGHGGLSTVIGSTSGSVLHQASCDILVVRVD
jgi:universal stress protein A